MSCDFFLSLDTIEAVKPGSLVVVRYGSSRSYFIRHDDGTGDMIGFTPNAGAGAKFDASGAAGYAWSPSTSTAWAPMMLRQRGDLVVLAQGMPRTGTPRDAALIVLQQVLPLKSQEPDPDPGPDPTQRHGGL